MKGDSIMRKKPYFGMVITAVVLLILSTVGCASKMATTKEQKVQLGQADSRISELQENNKALNKNLMDTKSALENAQNENKQLSLTINTLENQIATLESQKGELEKAVKAGKEFEEKSRKRTSSLNSQINALKKEVAEKGTLIASKDAEISSLQKAQAALKDSGANQNQQISALNDEKSTLSEQLKKTISSKNRLITILAVLLCIAVIVAILEFARRRKRT
jgi:chromosome segregation ATPase